MNIRFFGCGRFRWLAYESEDRPLTEREQAFLMRHRRVCQACARREEVTAFVLNMLREARMEAELPGESYDVRLLRRIRLEAARRSLRDWTPAAWGATIAALALLATLQLLGRSSDLPSFRTGASEALRIEIGLPDFPDIPIAERIRDLP
jgi:hypothetical protein